MQNETCPKCVKTERLMKLPLYDSMNRLPFVAVKESHPENPRKPRVAQTQFTADVCGACGYTEFHAINHSSLNELRTNGYEAVTF